MSDPNPVSEVPAKTLGQSAYEAWCKEVGHIPNWAVIGSQSAWERAATAAVDADNEATFEKIYIEMRGTIAQLTAEIERLRVIGSELVSSEIDWQHMTAQQQREYLDREKVIRSQAAAFDDARAVDEAWLRSTYGEPKYFAGRYYWKFGDHVLAQMTECVEYVIEIVVGLQRVLTNPTIAQLRHLLAALAPTAEAGGQS